jgi:hypothetical protein
MVKLKRMKANSMYFLIETSSENKIRYLKLPLFADWCFSKNQNALTSRSVPKIQYAKILPAYTFNPFCHFDGLGSDPNPRAIPRVQAR